MNKPKETREAFDGISSNSTENIETSTSGIYAYIYLLKMKESIVSSLTLRNHHSTCFLGEHICRLVLRCETSQRFLISRFPLARTTYRNLVLLKRQNTNFCKIYESISLQESQSCFVFGRLRFKSLSLSRLPCQFKLK
jgi:hypothetical protein